MANDLAHSQDRLSSIIPLLNKLKFPWKRIEAVNGNALSDKEFMTLS